MHDRKDDPVGTSEMKAFGEELLATGARYIDAGRRWLSDRRDQMGAPRGESDPHDPGHAHRGHDPARDARGHGPYRRGDDTSDRARAAWLGGGHERDADHRAAWRSARGADGGFDRAQADPAAAQDWRRQQRWTRDEDDRSTDWGQRQPGDYNDVDYLAGAPDFGHFGAYDREGRAGRAHSAGPSGDPGRSWRGVGPKGYVRPDARITEDLCEQLMHDDRIDASELSVRVDKGVVTLEGTVDQRWIKHRVEDLAERCPGVRDVDNRVRVRRGDADTPAGAHQPDTRSHPAPGSGAGAAGSLSASSQPGQGGTAGSLAGSAGATGAAHRSAAQDTSGQAGEGPDATPR